MKRPVAIGAIAAILSVLTVGIVLANRTPAGTTGAGAGSLGRDTLWYHASDVALLAKTGRPQLVEFFHPD